jgi:hypothetical protein
MMTIEPSHDSLSILEEALRCHRLAAVINDKLTVRILLEMAEGYEAKLVDLAVSN